MLLHKNDSLHNQKSIIIRRKIIAAQTEKNKIIDALTITDIDIYSKAKFDYSERPNGADQHILIYCTEGQGRARIQKEEYLINAGEFVIIPSSTPHVYGASKKDPWSIYWVHFKGSISDVIVSSLLTLLESHKGFVYYTEDRINLFNNIYNQLEKGYSPDNLAYANMSFWYYLTGFMFQDKYYNADKISKQDIAGKAINFMTQNIDQMIHLDEIAQSVNLSVSHFTSLFKKKTGFSPIEYYNQLKIQKACHYLFYTDLRIKEISFKLGINDPFYFSRLFTKVKGVSPNEYREKKEVCKKSI